MDLQINIEIVETWIREKLTNIVGISEKINKINGNIGGTSEVVP